MHMAHKLRVPAHFGIRSDCYKLIFFYGQNYKGRNRNTTPLAWEFYDLERDQLEMKNEYKNPEYKIVIAKMKAQLQNVRTELNETDQKFPHLKVIIDKNWDK